MMLSAGTRLGPYETLGLVRARGMGEVYRRLAPRSRTWTSRRRTPRPPRRSKQR